MALDSKHPLYSLHLDDWKTLRDTYTGERAVKASGTYYLPATSGMQADGMNVDQPGWKAYQAYLARAVFHDFVREAVEKLIGVMHHKPPTIELPAVMEPMLERATVNGESLQVLLRRINEAQLVPGRMGLLLDIPAVPPPGERPMPYIATYCAEDILNWDRGRNDDQTLPKLNFVALNESEYERNTDFEWTMVNKYRVLMLGQQVATGTTVAANQTGVYRAGVFRGTDAGGGASSITFSDALLREPSIMGRTLDKIPFVFINVKDIVPEPDVSPLLGLARLALAIYRGEADYRQNLFMQGQDTLVTTGAIQNEGETVRVGAGARLDLPMGATAEYIGVSGEGLSEQRSALENDKKMASSKGAQLLDTSSREKESGDALKVRVSAQTASLNQIALAGAYGLETILKMAAEWLGADPKQVKVVPNLDFDDMEMTGKDLVELMTGKNLGAPLSRVSIHKRMQEKGLTELTLEEEMALIEDEEPLSPAIALPSSGEPEDDGDEEGDEGDTE